MSCPPRSSTKPPSSPSSSTTTGWAWSASGQELIYENRFSQTTTERGPDFVKLADANGLKGRRVTTVEELEAAIQEALEEQKKGLGYVVDCTIEETELVRPMVNGGTHITEFLVN